MSEVFISYSHKDQKIVTRIYNDLVRHQIIVWRDENQNRRLGMSLPDVILNNIENCKFFCLMISSDAFSSEWVQKEYKLAREKSKMILPCLIQPIDMEVLKDIAHPFYGLQDIFYADFISSYEQAMFELLEKMEIIYHPFYPDIEEFLTEVAQKVEPMRSGNYLSFSEYFQEATKSHKQNNYDQAIEKLEIIVRTKPELVTPKIALGNCYGLIEKHKEAAAEFKKVTEMLNSDFRGWAGLGAAKYYLGDFEEAIAAFRKALDLRRNAYELLNNYGRALLRLRRSKEAIKVFQQAHERMQNNDPNILAGLGTALLWNSQYHLAVEAFQKVLIISSTPMEEVVCGLGEALEKLNRFDEARQIYCKGQSTNDPEIIRRLARLEWRMGNITCSLKLFDELCQQTENRRVYLVEMAQLLHTLGRQKEMLVKCEESLKDKAVSATDYYYAGLAYFLLGEKIASASHYNTACKMDHEFVKFNYHELL